MSIVMLSVLVYLLDVFPRVITCAVGFVHRQTVDVVSRGKRLAQKFLASISSQTLCTVNSPKSNHSLVQRVDNYTEFPCMFIMLRSFSRFASFLMHQLRQQSCVILADCLVSVEERICCLATRP